MRHRRLLEVVIISTCNRTEIYVVADQLHTGRYFVKQFLADWFDVPMDKFSSYLQLVDHDDAIEHLLRVATGLNSMVLGETQILGQVRDALFLAHDSRTNGTIFNEIFNRVMYILKEAKSTTDTA